MSEFKCKVDAGDSIKAVDFHDQGVHLLATREDEQGSRNTQSVVLGYADARAFAHEILRLTGDEPKAPEKAEPAPSEPTDFVTRKNFCSAYVLERAKCAQTVPFDGEMAARMAVKAWEIITGASS